MCALLAAVAALPPHASADDTAPAPPTDPTERPPPENAADAVDRARAAYFYGDMEHVIESVRLVVEGVLPASAAQKADCLRFLGIALYLTGRARGAEDVFVQLLRLNPRAELDPKTTRADVVAFFSDVATRYRAETRAAARARKSAALNFLPPAGQFQNGDRTKAWIIVGLETLTLATAVTTFAVLKSKEEPGHTFPGFESEARTLKTVNWVAIGALAATWLYGTIDGFTGSDRLPDEEPQMSFVVLPNGGGLRLRF